jgi:hypothetical protein
VVVELLGADGHELRQRVWAVADVNGFGSRASFDAGDGTRRRRTSATKTALPTVSVAQKVGPNKTIIGEVGRVQVHSLDKNSTCDEAVDFPKSLLMFTRVLYKVHFTAKY